MVHTEIVGICCAANVVNCNNDL
uniref:Uncharacterized protein n=1 Tax=Arundo donax TaxID=35708 RepID=A0A0A9ACL6_ARUDO